MTTEEKIAQIIDPAGYKNRDKQGSHVVARGSSESPADFGPPGVAGPGTRGVRTVISARNLPWKTPDEAEEGSARLVTTHRTGSYGAGVYGISGTRLALNSGGIYIALFNGVDKENPTFRPADQGGLYFDRKHAIELAKAILLAIGDENDDEHAKV